MKTMPSKYRLYIILHLFLNLYHGNLWKFIL
nr:MAG TPA: hypothetical protein [Caudoviricetes sp.]